MTAQGKAIVCVLKAAGLRPPARVMTWENDISRVDWDDDGVANGLERCAAALEAEGWVVTRHPACLTTTRQLGFGWTKFF